MDRRRFAGLLAGLLAGVRGVLKPEVVDAADVTWEPASWSVKDMTSIGPTYVEYMSFQLGQKVHWPDSPFPANYVPMIGHIIALEEWWEDTDRAEVRCRVQFDNCTASPWRLWIMADKLVPVDGGKDETD